MTLLRWFLMVLLLLAAVWELEAVVCSDSFAADVCDNPQGYLSEVW